MEDFPVDECGRKFNKISYSRLLPDGEMVYRNWFIYSKHKRTYITITITRFLISLICPHYQIKVYKTGNTGVLV